MLHCGSAPSCGTAQHSTAQHSTAFTQGRAGQDRAVPEGVGVLHVLVILERLARGHQAAHHSGGEHAAGVRTTLRHAEIRVGATERQGDSTAH